MDYGTKDFPPTGSAPFGAGMMNPSGRYAAQTVTRLAYFLHMARFFHKREAQHSASGMPISAEHAAYQAGKYLGWAYSIATPQA